MEPARADAVASAVRDEEALRLLGHHSVRFRMSEDLLFHQRDSLPLHPNGLRLTALSESGDTVCSEEFYSVGGGFVLTASEAKAGMTGGSEPARPLPYPFTFAADLLAQGRQHGLSIAELLLANEGSWRPRQETESGLDHIWSVMEQCIERGLRRRVSFPGDYGFAGGRLPSTSVSATALERTIP